MALRGNSPLNEFDSDDNGDDEDVKIDPELQRFCENFTFENSHTCWVCNGYYGPSYEEPVCGACHAFLFASEAVEEPSRVPLSDDEDSGNDEPPYNATGVNPSHSNANVPANLNAEMEAADEEENMEEDVDDDEVPEDMIEANVPPEPVAHLPIVRPRPDPPRNVLQYLDLLSVPRVNDRNDPRRIEALATEVLLCIFSYLDDLSLASVSRVCRRWRNIVQAYTSEEMWSQYTKKRWPLFQEVARVPSWLEMFSTLMDSCFCRSCLIDMAQKIPTQFGGNNYRKIRLQNENDQVTDGIDFIAIDDQLTHLSASIVGPPSSPYEGGRFFLYIVVPQFYPMFPPTVRFLTKIFHPNVSRHGDVGIDIIQHNWSLALTIPKILLSVQSLLTDPFTEICMEPAIGRMFETDPVRFEALAKHWTMKYAMHELIPPV